MEEAARGPARNTMPTRNTRANALNHRWSDEKEKGQWYAGGFAYWSGEAATNDGMLGGFADVDVADTADSIKFMKQCGALPESKRNGGSRALRALDVGAGIGRVTGGEWHLRPGRPRLRPPLPALLPGYPCYLYYLAILATLHA